MQFNSALFNQLSIFLLNLIFISLAFPSPPITTIAIILFLLLGLKNIKTQKWSFYSKVFIGLSSIYFLSSLLSHILYDEVLWINQFTKNFYFLLLPIGFLLHADSINKKVKKDTLKLFAISVLVFSFLGLLKIIYLHQLQLVNKIFYESYAQALKIHSTYYSLLVVIAFTYYINRFLSYTRKNKKILYFSATIYLLAIAFLLSARIGLITILIISVFSFFKQRKNIGKKTLILFGLVFLGISAIFFTGGYAAKRISNTVFKNEAGKSDSENRLVLWQNVICAYKKGPSNLLGGGLEKSQSRLNQCYKESGFFGYENKYNAHNQYLQNLMENGVIGLLIIFSILASVLYFSFKHDLIYLQYISFIFILFFVTESVLERQLGITTFLAFVSLFIAAKNEN
ncbi:O-antigen ligase family protein [Haloflavibacter putidus]|uniref:O-antigen ligase family protein n=1 Tax=Haloflavibacter putidus TaxID=2576776 RepID=A0A507ZT01_9FLAO|nr:O-antigen ligase family protein [Haloflavibacter putidus]TQD40760.1 O-antigen ligase family protein [Haloflavibacter putidus]